ncbi:MAG: ketodeoxygluconokinase [Rickettsiales bacterium]|nr:ketodeoxygluconokinase [Rickettsiales bacterium]|tara:strand:+ start:2209 stop:3147 length:939 start_codon:yes stop_codon:yes gene_type:complete
MKRSRYYEKKIACIGECMLELSGKTFDQMTLSFGGDTLNTAIYLARLGQTVDYHTALGDDTYSDWMVDKWQSEGINTNSVIRMPSRLPGIYAIQTDARGERHFHYWRDQAPARDLFSSPKAKLILEGLPQYKLIYLSGISISLYNDAGREKLSEFLKKARAAGSLIAFDSNYRTSGWPDLVTAQSNITNFLRITDIALPTFDDDQQLFGIKDADACADYLHHLGVSEIAVKMGERGCMVSSRGSRVMVATTPDEPIDTTGAGDSFNAAYLAKRLDGIEPKCAAAFANDLARTVIMYPGAVIPRTAMPVRGAL